LGIITVSQFTFVRLPDIFKGIVMFTISALFLLAGLVVPRWLNSKQASVFSLGLTSVGVAGLYASLSVSYFILSILSMYPAIILCILITAGAFALSQRYDAQNIAAFALIGGYLPMFSMAGNTTLLYAAMVYYVVLNLFALVISCYKQWRFSMFIGFSLNFIVTAYIVTLMYGQINHASDGVFLLSIQLPTVAYVFFAFANYTLIPIISSYRIKRPLVKADVVLLSLNAVLSALLMYAALDAMKLSDFTGIAALVFAAAYLCLGWSAAKRMGDAKRTIALFYLTGLTFVVLVIPLQFGRAWLSLGWLAQAVALAIYGILYDAKPFKKAGMVIGGLCLGAFIIFDLGFRVDHLFAYKYLAITAGSVLVLTALAYKKSFFSFEEKTFKYASVINLWLYFMYLVYKSRYFLFEWLNGSLLDAAFLLNAMGVTVTFLFAATLPRITAIADKGTRIITVVLSVLGMLMLFAVTQYSQLFGYGIGDRPPLTVMFIATLVLIMLCALAVLTMYNILKYFTRFIKLPPRLHGRAVSEADEVRIRYDHPQWLPFGVSAYFLIILTQNLITQYRLSTASIVISLIFIITALAWVIFGFIRRVAFMRRFGLGLSIMAVAKLFLIDLSGLTTGSRIVSFFAFGATMLGISFVYQHFNKRLIKGTIGGSGTDILGKKPMEGSGGHESESDNE
jgi:hypothetical protein